MKNSLFTGLKKDPLHNKMAMPFCLFVWECFPDVADCLKLDPLLCQLVSSPTCLWLSNPSLAQVLIMQLVGPLVYTSIFHVGLYLDWLLLITFNSSDLSSHSPTSHTDLHVRHHCLTLPGPVYPDEPSLSCQPTKHVEYLQLTRHTFSCFICVRMSFCRLGGATCVENFTV